MNIKYPCDSIELPFAKTPGMPNLLHVLNVGAPISGHASARIGSIHACTALAYCIVVKITAPIRAIVAALAACHGTYVVKQSTGRSGRLPAYALASRWVGVGHDVPHRTAAIETFSVCQMPFVRFPPWRSAAFHFHHRSDEA